MAVLLALAARRNNAKTAKDSQGGNILSLLKTVDAFCVTALRSCVQRMMPAWRDTRAGVGRSQHGTFTAYCMIESRYNTKVARQNFELFEYICRCSSSSAAPGRLNRAPGTSEGSASSRHLRNRT